MNADNWFTIDEIDSDTYIISEYRHWERPHCYLLCGSERSLLIDTGLGICKIAGVAARLAPGYVVPVVTHVHWDHIGGLGEFPEFYAHEAELDWLHGDFPLGADEIRAMVADCCELPQGFDVSKYKMFQGEPSRVLHDGDWIELGGRSVEVLHTPGHSPGHICLWEPERGYLYTGDLVYAGKLLAYYPSTDPEAYLNSLKRIAALPARRIFPGHNSLDVKPELVTRMCDALCELKLRGELHHGSGVHEYGDWSIWL